MGRAFTDYLRGYVRIRIVGNSYDRFLNLCAYHRILLWNLEAAEHGYEANLSIADFRKLRDLLRKSRVSLRITERHGLPFFLHRYRKRKVYVAGIAAAFVFMLWLSSHVWQISIDGNLAQTDEVLYDYLEQNGVCHGMKKAGIDCKALAAQIRNSFSDFSWVAVELNGTQLQIHVKEGIFDEQADTDAEYAAGPSPDYPLGNSDAAPSDLVASASGTVDSLYVRRGLAQVSPGDPVEAGQLLVSGTLPIYNDSGEVSSCQYVAADADIVIRTRLPYHEELPIVTREKVYTGREQTRYLVRAGEVPFALPLPAKEYSHYDVVGITRQAKLMEHFYLPLYLCSFRMREYRWEERQGTKEELEAALNTNLQVFLENLEEKGVQIFENDVKIEWTEQSVSASGTLLAGYPAVKRTALSAATQSNTQEEHEEE